MNTRGLLIALAVMAGCSHALTRPANVGQLRLYWSGEATFNGVPVSFDGLRAELEALNRNSNAIVRYWRENPAGKMPSELAAIAERAPREVVKLGLPIAVSTQPDLRPYDRNREDRPRSAARVAEADRGTQACPSQ